MADFKSLLDTWINDQLPDQLPLTKITKVQIISSMMAGEIEPVR